MDSMSSTQVAFLVCSAFIIAFFLGIVVGGFVLGNGNNDTGANKNNGHGVN